MVSEDQLVARRKGGKRNADRPQRREKSSRRPKGDSGPNALTLRRGLNAAISRDSGIASDEQILRVLSPKAKSDPTDTLDRWESAYRTFVITAQSLDAAGCRELAAFQRGIIKAWQLPRQVRAQVWAARGEEARRPIRDGQTRANATHALRRLEKAGDQLTAAYAAAGIKRVAKVGENVAAQRIVATRSPEGALAALGWIQAEIDSLERYEISISADRTAGVIHVPRRFVRAGDDELLLELRHRIAALRDLAAEITGTPIVIALRSDSERFGRLTDALDDAVDRVCETNALKGRDEPEEVAIKRAIGLARTPHIFKLANDLAGDQSEELVAQLVRQGIRARAAAVGWQIPE